MKRRKFITNSVAAAAGTFVLPTIVPASAVGRSPQNDKINIGWIGNGRQGSGDIRATMRFDSCVVTAVADVDSNRMNIGKQLIENFYNRQSGSNKAVNVKMHGDYKDLLADKSLDAVMITTPDHWHAQPAMKLQSQAKTSTLRNQHH